jgi:hypothetical protein
MAGFETNAELIRTLLLRLERISADSYWAHRASGIRGSLIKALEKIDTNQVFNKTQLNHLIELGFVILEHSAKEKRINRI